jgi:hypothetical protein
MKNLSLAALLSVALALVVCLVAIPNRYTFIAASGSPLLYRCDRWTGRVWITQPDHNSAPLHWERVADTAGVPW